MRDVITFLTSKEIIVVYIVAAVACFLAFIIYLIDKGYDKRKQRHNTKELNKLVEEVSEVIKEENGSYNEPILQPVVEQTAPSLIETKQPEQTVEILEEEEKLEEPVITASVTVENVQPIVNVEPVVSQENAKEDSNIVLQTLNDFSETVKDKDFEKMLAEPVVEDNHEEKLQYTTMEPNPEQAKEELRKLVEVLEEEEKNEQNPQTIITNYEEQQESNAIISLEELVKRSKEMYANNELNQYKDEGNEPISLTDLEMAKEANNKPYYKEPFIISNAVSDMEEQIDKPEQQIEQLQINDFANVTSNNIANNVVDTNKSIEITNVSDEVNQATMPVQPKVENLYQTSKFKKSPVISPIYGIERSDDDYLELENTANYDKLDEEIRKTNEFLMTLKELQKNLD